MTITPPSTGHVTRIYRPAVSPEGHHPGFGYRTETIDGVFVERDVAIPMRDGTTIYGDVFRPEGKTDIPAIVCYAPFGKHPHIDLEAAFAGSDIPVERLSPQTPFEVFDPITWGKEGFAICVVDGTGSWYSEGRAHFFDIEKEATAGYDCVEFFAEQEWCNGKIGWGGVSYYGMTAWSVAALQPPHLSAILPWDAASDSYRETNFHGGIPSALIHNWMRITGVGLSEVEDMEAAGPEHPLFDEFWQARVAEWSNVTVPTYAVTEWGNDLHLRGTIQAWREIASTEKFLDITGDKEWAGFYSDWAFTRQREFFGQYLLGEDNGVQSWAPVRIALRERGRDWTFREENEFPLARTEYRTYALDAATGSARATDVAEESSVSYSSTERGAGASFDLRFDEDTEITGYSKVRLWISSDTTNDADVFIGYDRIDVDGNVVPFIFSQMWEEGPAAFGWLRASHRELDEQASTPWQPVHLHQHRQWLIHSVPVPIDVEVWPTNLMFAAGETLRIHVRGTMIHPDPDAPFSSAFITTNRGEHVLHTGGRFDSQVVLPVIPEQM